LIAKGRPRPVTVAVNATAPSRPVPLSIGIADVAMWVMAAACLLNLNGFVTMMFGVGQTFSLVILACALILIAMGWKHLFRDRTVIVFVAALMLYIICSVLASGFRGVFIDPEMVQFYLVSVIVISGAFCYTAMQTDLRRLELTYDIGKWLLVLACVATLFSGLLTRLYQVEVASANYRASGLFANPNEAAIIAALGVAAWVAKPSRVLWIQLAALGVCAAACAMTLSRTGILALFAIMAVYAWNKRSVGMGVAAIIGVLMFPLLAGLALQIPAVESNLAVYRRLSEVAGFFSGQIDGDTTAGRTELWAVALDNLPNSLPFGGGLSTYHFMEWMRSPQGIWQGAHNTFIMILGESGVIPFAVFLFAIWLVFQRANQFKGFAFAMMFFAIFNIDMMFSHNILTMRYHNYLIGFVLGGLYWLEQNRAREAAALAKAAS
jgi:O-antigen ligase